MKNYLNRSRNSMGMGCSKRTTVKRAMRFTLSKVLLTATCIMCVSASNAQSELWMVGNKLLDFNDPNNVVVQALPQPSVTTGMQERVYSGQMPVLSEFAEYNQNGELLFFEVDGSIYDKEGYLMVKKEVTDFEAYDNYPSYILDMQIVKIPNHCDKYYIIMGQNDDNVGIFSVAVLDMTLPNAYWPGERLGGLIDFESYTPFLSQNDEAGASSVYEINFYDFLDQSGQSNSLISGVGLEGHLITLHGSIAGGGQFITSDHCDLVVQDNNANGIKKLFAAKQTSGWSFDIAENGIFCNPEIECLGYSNDWPRLNDRMTISKYNNEYFVFTPNTNNISYYLSRYNSNWDLVECMYPDLGNSLEMTDEVISAECSQNGQYIYLIHPNAPYFEYFDLNNIQAGTVPLASINSLSGISSYADCSMALNFFEGQPSIYLFHAAGVAVLKGVNNPATVTLVSNPFPTLTMPVYDLTAIGITSVTASGYSPFANPVMVQGRTYFSQQQPELLQDACCQTNINNSAPLGHIVTAGAATWTFGIDNNPWDVTTGPVYMNGDLIFNPGANITINGMEFRFSLQANVVINTGAYVKLNNGSKWTSYECDLLMWPGVNLMGNPNSNQSSADNPYTAQGVFAINNSTIENARTGVEVGTTNLNGGGVLKGNYALFQNCQNGVRYRPYNKVQYGNWSNSRWMITAQLNDPTIIPGTMVQMTNMKYNISFILCSWVNSTPLMTYLTSQRGVGINASNSQFTISGGQGSFGGGGDPYHTSFYKWRTGIKATNGGTTSFTANTMYFQECNIAITATAVNNESIVGNNFTVPSNAYITNEKPRGVILYGCSGFTFRENIFAGTSSTISTNTTAQNVGAMLVKCGDADNLSYRNTFSHLWKGQEVQQDNIGFLTGLQLRCNTYNNIRFDQYLASNSEWRHNQGDAGGLTLLASNRFSLEWPDCQQGRYDMYVDPVHNPGYEFDYIRPNNEWYIPNATEPYNTAELECLLSPFMDEFCPGQYILFDNPTNAQLCPLIPDVTDIGGGIAEHEDKLEALQQAKNIYALTIDNNNTNALIDALNSAFPLESSLLANYLMGSSPLSSEVLTEAINESETLNPWHLTQVLLANSPLPRDVMYNLEQSEILSAFFMSLIYDAQIPGTFNLRKLLELEIASCEAERHISLLGLLDYYNAHADQIDICTSTRDLMLMDGSRHAQLWLLDYYIEEGAATSAEALLSEIATWPDMQDLVAFKTIQLELNGDWNLLHPNQMTSLENWAANPASAASAEALAVLHHLDLTDALPEPELPFDERGSNIRTVRKPKVSAIVLNTYPNPAKENTFVTYPSELDGIGQLHVYNELGQTISTLSLNGKGIAELDIQGYPVGLYLVCLVVEGKTLAETKLIVVE
ncbi:MAG: T9SS type A sorting domain-containing protein [Flavobacteriales bacterium]